MKEELLDARLQVFEWKPGEKYVYLDRMYASSDIRNAVLKWLDERDHEKVVIR